MKQANTPAHFFVLSNPTFAGWLSEEGLWRFWQGWRHHQPDLDDDDPQEHGCGGQQVRHGQLRLGGRRGGDGKIHIHDVLSGRFFKYQNQIYFDKNIDEENVTLKVAAKFMIEDDEEQMKEELKEAFRIYDKEGQGFITNEVLKEILREIDSTLTENDLDNIIEEVDEDGSGTMDFDEFQEMMMGWWWKYVNKYIVNLIPSV